MNSGARQLPRHGLDTIEIARLERLLLETTSQDLRRLFTETELQLIAMECRLCKRCTEGIQCPVELDRVNPEWGSARIRNLVAGWHNQLLEVLGAMGMREVRRLRGEMGRAMFYEDLEKEFAALGKRG